MLQMPLRPAAPRECLPTQRTLVFSGNAVEKITNSALDEVVVTDTIPLRQDALDCPKIRQLSCSSLLGETISRIACESSVSSLFAE